MKKLQPTSGTASLEWEPKYPFDLVIAYEDAATRNRAMLLYDRIAQQLIDDYDFQCAWWKFDHLREASLMEQAIDDAITANMIILSLSAERELPEAATQWLEAWIPNKAGNKSALVALLNMPQSAAAHAGSLQTFLQQTARRAHMDFFLHSVDTEHEEHHYTIDSIDRRAGLVTPFLENILHLHPRVMPTAL